MDAVLTEKQQAVLACWDFGFRGDMEIAERVGCSRSTVGRVKAEHGLTKKYRKRNMTRAELEDWFWSQCDLTEAGCLEWQGAHLNPDDPVRRYGVLRWADGTRLAHRVAYELANGPFDKDLYVLHACDNPTCCNPDHLSVGTQADNMRDMTEKGRGSGPGGGSSA